MASASFTAAASLGACAIQPKHDDKAHIILVHGAWHGAWCWHKVIPLLRQSGHLVTAVDLPGRYSDPKKMAAIQATDYVNTVGEVIDTTNRPIVLVGHSLGGATISLVAEKYPDRVRRLIYLTAFLVPNGQTVGAVAASDKASRIRESVRRDAATNTSTVIPEAARDLFYGDCTDDDVRMAIRLLSPEPAQMNAAVMRLSTNAFEKVERVYVECIRDNAISIDKQREMRAKLPCRHVVTLDASHSPFISHPVEIAKIIAQFA